MQFTKEWFKAAAIRALKTIAQTAIATIGTAAVIGQVDWILVGSASLMAGILSILTSIAGLPEVKKTEEIKKLEEKESESAAIEEQVQKLKAIEKVENNKDNKDN